MFQKTANMIVEEPRITVANWSKLRGDNTSVVRSKIAAIPSDKKYLLSHCTIVASVMTEGDPHDWLIKPECSQFVNSNLDAWSNEVLRMSYTTFIGSYNFEEHYQNSQASKGKIFDAVLRKVWLTADVYIYFVDILVGTDYANEELIQRILSNRLSTMSMGCVTDVVVCSWCGHKADDKTPLCAHLAGRDYIGGANKGKIVADDDGVPRIIAELCGHKSLPGGGVKFIEASWVEVPAFAGATRRNTVQDIFQPSPVMVANGSKAAALRINDPSGQLKVATRNSPFSVVDPLDLGSSAAVLNSRLRHL